MTSGYKNVKTESSAVLWVVSRYIAQTRDEGLGVIFITHNVHHAYPVGDRFTILKRGRSYGTFEKSGVTREEVASMMAGGEEMEDLSSELAEFERADAEEEAKREGRAPQTASSHDPAESLREETDDLHQEEERGPRPGR